jgi:hypothetical protein
LLSLRRKSFHAAIGHAVDFELGNYSQNDPAFIAAYQAEAALITDPAEVAVLAYQLQAGGAGQEETFAALFAVLTGGYSRDAALDALLSRSFPNTAAQVRAAVQP